MSAIVISESDAYGEARKLLPRWQSTALFEAAWFESEDLILEKRLK